MGGSWAINQSKKINILKPLANLKAKRLVPRKNSPWLPMLILPHLWDWMTNTDRTFCKLGTGDHRPLQHKSPRRTLEHISTHTHGSSWHTAYTPLGSALRGVGKTWLPSQSQWGRHEEGSSARALFCLPQNLDDTPAFHPFVLLKTMYLTPTATAWLYLQGDLTPPCSHTLFGLSPPS